MSLTKCHYFNHKFVVMVTEGETLPENLVDVALAPNVDPIGDFVNLVLGALLIDKIRVSYIPWDSSFAIYTRTHKVSIECSPVVDFFTTLRNYCNKPNVTHRSFTGLVVDNLFKDSDVFTLKSVHKTQLAVLTDKEKVYHEALVKTLERYKTTLGHSLGLAANLQHFKCPYSLNEHHENTLTKLNKALVPLSRVFATTYETYPDIYKLFISYLDQLDIELIKAEAYVKYYKELADATSD